MKPPGASTLVAPPTLGWPIHVRSPVVASFCHRDIWEERACLLAEAPSTLRNSPSIVPCDSRALLPACHFCPTRPVGCAREQDMTG